MLSKTWLAITKTEIREQAKVLLQTKAKPKLRARGSTLEAESEVDQLKRKNFKQILVPTKALYERELRQQRIIGAAFLTEEEATYSYYSLRHIYKYELSVALVTTCTRYIASLPRSG